MRKTWMLAGAAMLAVGLGACSEAGDSAMYEEAAMDAEYAAEAKALCAELSSRNVGCLVVRPGS